MLPLLAQTPPPAGLASWLENFFWIVGSIGALIGCAVGVRSLLTKSDSMPQPLVTTEHPKVANQGDIDQLHGRIKRERIELEEKIAALQAEDLRLREKLDSDIADLHDRINNVPERTIKLLRETKGLI
jgi:hypothetical protein